MADPKGILPFDQFLAAVNEARHTEFAARPASKVAHEDSFAEMRTHILRLYDGVEVLNSFVDENGSVFDCVPVEQQPSLRGAAGPVPSPPDMPSMNAPASATEERRDAQVPPQMAENKNDQFGNVMYCPPGTIPMRRVTLEDLTRFEDMRSFFQKAPGGGAIPPRLSRPQQPEPPQVAATHRWAHAFQSVNNVGGHSFLNLWQPAIGANQIFSLSQHWYAGGSGANLQTAEVGWQVYPQFYNNSPRPVFFIYWTADGYGSTGCYNLTCSAFVQTNNSWAIGGAIPTPYSSTNGPQYSLEVAYYLFQGRWWLYVKGTNASNAIGYYPASIYNNGALSRHAESIDYGGETVGTTSFPPMGSGAFANAGWQKAAYQRQIYYFPAAGGSAWANLTASQSWPNCYTTQLNTYASPWNTSLWFGGPGGNC